MNSISINPKEAELKRIEHELGDDRTNRAVQLLKARKNLSFYAQRFIEYHIALTQRAKQLHEELDSRK